MRLSQIVPTFLLPLAALVLSGSCSLVHGQGHAAWSEAELAGKRFQLPPGFKLDVFAAEPMLESPVAIATDPAGRVYVSETRRLDNSVFDITKHTPWLLQDLELRTVEDRVALMTRLFPTNLAVLTRQSERLRVIEDTDGDGRADRATTLAEGFNDIASGVAAGVLATRDAVWFANIPDLWRFPLTQAPNQPPTATDRQRLHSGYGVHIGVTGHDLHGLVQGPDGRIYFSIGDRGFHVRSKEGRTFAFPDTGAVLRCEPDGTNLEVFAIGLRNPQELAFDNHGNLFTADNDTAGPDNCRFIHVVQGADYGWRCSYQHQPGFGPWVQERLWEGGQAGILPHGGNPAAGPSGLAFDPGTGLPPELQDHFLLCDFPGGIWRFKVQPRGASFEMTGREKFLWNLLPTDVEFGPDGAIYVSDWVEGWTVNGKGRLYRLTQPHRADSPVVAETRRLLAAGMAHRSIPDLTSLLSHPNRRVRTEAHLELATRGQEAVGPLMAVVADHSQPLARLHALWAIEVGERRHRMTAPSELLNLLSDADPEIVVQTARIVGENGWLRAAEPLIPLVSTNAAPRVRAAAATALARLVVPPAPNGPGHSHALFPIPTTRPERGALASPVPDAVSTDALSTTCERVLVALLPGGTEDPFLVHAGTLLLTWGRQSELAQRFAHHPSAPLRQAALSALRRLDDPGVVDFLDDADPGIATDAARAIHDAPIPGAFPMLARRLESLPKDSLLRGALLGHTNSLRPIRPAARARRIINASFRIGGSDEAHRLARFAAADDVPEALRADALEALGQWKNPPPLDRVVGLWRPLAPRRPEGAVAALDSILPSLLQSTNDTVLLAGLRAATALGSRPAPDRLAALFGAPDRSEALRREVLITLAAGDSPLLTQTVQRALNDRSETVRAEAVRLIAKVEPAAAARELERLLASEPSIRLRQSALGALGQLPTSQAGEPLVRQLQALQQGRLAAGLQLDLLEAAAQHPQLPALQELLRAFEAAGGPPESTNRWQPLLAGGDRARGVALFKEKVEIACIRCHAVGGAGGTVGPALDGIAGRQTRVQLLESILQPNRQIAPGFENVVVTLRDGTTHSGVVKRETEAELELHSPEDGLLTVTKTAIESRARGASAMPDGLGDLLTRRELRDLLEYLASLKR